MAEHKITVEFAPGRTMEFSTGKMANLANGSCVARMGDTVVLAAACSGPARPGSDFFPLQVDYREKYSAAGKFPGGYIKREGRPTTKEILTCRVIDRPIRPMFPEGFFDEVQVQCLLLAADGIHEADVLAMVASSLSLTLSDLPFDGPIASVRVGKVGGEFVVNPNIEEMAKSSLDLIYAGKPGKVVMIEGEASECSEAELREAMYVADAAVTKLCGAQTELAKIAGKAKKEYKLYLVPEDLMKGLENACSAKLEAACTVPGKNDRIEALNALLAEARTTLRGQFAGMSDDEFALETNKGFDDLVRTVTRNVILEKEFRPDGRATTDLRPLSAEVGVLPVVHGSALFSRGETQALVVTVLGNEDAAQEADNITSSGVTSKRFYLHYNFPNFSVGEVGRITGPGRREIGHGDLAERSVSKVIPKDFPYVVRCVSEVMSSNGSTSMASVCGAILSLMDAGVPIKAPVAGISCGLVTSEDGSKNLLLTDILGAEDHFGDMDFKVCGTREGITGFQLDLKLPGIPIELLCEGMERNRIARLRILDVIESCIAQPRAEISPRAPQFITVKINPEKIGGLIGPGGKNIRAITEETQATIDINDDGSVKIMAADKAHLDAAKDRVLGCTAEAEIGKIYRGKVVSVRDFGAFVEIMPGMDGLLHISEMADYRVREVKDICSEGDFVTVKVIDIDQSGKIRLSRKAALKEMGE